MEDDRDGRAVASASDYDAAQDHASSRREAVARTRNVNDAVEREVLERWGRGEQEVAFRLLMTTYGARVLAFARRLTRDEEAAQDVRQQVFLEAWRGLDDFQGRASLWTWLCAITHYRCVDAGRRVGRKRAHEIVVDFDVLATFAPSSEPAMAVDRLAEFQALEYCLRQLPPAIRSQVLMRYAEGLSHAEIAEAVGDAPGTVQVRLARVLVKLRRCLATRGARR